jgi:hypothetical protein
LAEIRNLGRQGVQGLSLLGCDRAVELVGNLLCSRGPGLVTPGLALVSNGPRRDDVLGGHIAGLQGQSVWQEVLRDDEGDQQGDQQRDGGRSHVRRPSAFDSHLTQAQITREEAPAAAEALESRGTTLFHCFNRIAGASRHHVAYAVRARRLRAAAIFFFFFTLGFS